MSIEATDPRPVVVLDIDNCCANDAWRIPHIEWDKTGDERYKVYHALSHLDENDFDSLGKAMARISIDPGFARIMFLTSRPVAFRELTLSWLRDHCPWAWNSSDLVMRNPGDHRHSQEVKAEQLHSLFAHYGVTEVAAAFDDRQEVLDAYSATRLPVRALMRWAIHDVCAYSGPLQPAAKSAHEILREGADTYEQRNKLYGDNYKVFGHTMLGIFPHGVTLNTIDDWNRMGILIQCAAKLTRYGQTFHSGGHRDSALDLSVYAAMLTELTEER